MYEKEREMRFQYELAKLQSDFEFSYAYMFTILAILFGLFVYYRDNPLGMLGVFALIVLGAYSLHIIQRKKEKRFEEIRKQYLESYWD